MVHIETKIEFTDDEVDELKRIFNVETKKAVMAALMRTYPSIPGETKRVPWKYGDGHEMFDFQISGRNTKVWSGWGVAMKVIMTERHYDNFFGEWVMNNGFRDGRNGEGVQAVAEREV